MRYLKNLDVFTKQKAKLYQWNAKSGLAFSTSSEVPIDAMSLEIPTGEKLALYCNYLACAKIKGRRIHRRRGQDFLSLEYVSSGELHMRSGATGYVAEQGDLCLLKPGIIHEFYYPETAKCQVYGFIIRGRKVSELLRFFGLDNVDAIHLGNAKALMEIRSRLCALLESGKVDADALRRNAGLVFEMLQLVAENCATANYSPHVAEVLRLMEEHMAEPMDMKQLAARFHCSLPTFNKRFTAEVGETPYKHLIRMRLSKAAELLRSETEPIKEIALEVGYANPLHFSEEFHRLHGISPRSYRLNARNA